ncbi:MAG: PIN-like domain-containing protein [Chloroflexota bacterium]
MPDENAKPKDSNILTSSTVYPEADAVFTAQPKTLPEIKDDCIVVLDTNSLLVLYSIGKESLEQIKKTYQSLVKHKRLVIPGQVAREFAKNRATKLAELFQQLNRKKNIAPFRKGKYPLLESLPDYQESVGIEEELDKLLDAYKKAIGQVLEHIQAWTWNDPVSLLYHDLFNKDTVFDPSFEKGKLKEELESRYLHQIPPGYKDASKDDGGIGDLLIWKTILELGATQKKNAILVSGEEKPDWWHKSEGQALYPRFELFDEYRRVSSGGSFHIVSFSKFLDLYGASEEVVQEVRQTEIQESTIQAQRAASYSESIQFTFKINKSFVNYNHHPITIPRAFYDQIEASGFESDSVLITSPYGSVRGAIYSSEAGYGRYFQIVMRGGSQEDPLSNFRIGQTILVEIGAVNNVVQVKFSELEP